MKWQQQLYLPTSLCSGASLVLSSFFLAGFRNHLQSLISIKSSEVEREKKLQICWWWGGRREKGGGRSKINNPVFEEYDKIVFSN